MPPTDDRSDVVSGDRSRSTLDARAQALLDVAGAIAGEGDLESVLAQVLESAQALTAARYAAIGVLDASRTRLIRFLTVGVDEQTRREIGVLPSGHGVLGELIHDPRPLRLPDVSGHPRSYGFPSGHPPMRTFVGVPVMVDGEPWGNLYLTEKDGGGEFSEDDEDALVLLASLAGHAIKNAERYAVSEDRRVALEQSVAALDASLQIGRAVGAETDLSVILTLVAKRGRALLNARAVVIEALDGDELVVAAAAGEFPMSLVGERVKAEGSVGSVALRTQRTQRLDDAEMRRRFREQGLGRSGFELEFGLVVPLVFRQQGYGVIIIADRLDGGAPFSDEETAMVEGFAASAATAVATAHSADLQRRRARVAASESERARWARELHDETLQSLASIRLMVGSIKRLITGGPTGAPADARVIEALDAMSAQVGQEIVTLRSLITELRPAAIDDLGLESALVQLGERAERIHDLHVEIEVDVDPATRNPELDTAVYRIVQEALTNAYKHGRAHTARVSVLERPGHIEVSVTDDGDGFDTSRHTDGFGLLGMRERAELLTGTVSVDSTPGNGTRVQVRLPNTG